MALNRRTLLAGATTIAATAALPRLVRAQGAGPFTLPPLPYATNVFEPNIDAKTMEIHHDRHHQAYVTNLNNAVKDYPNVAAMPLQEILAKLGEIPEAIRTTVRNNAGGHANHSMFWEIMGPNGGEPGGELFAAITRDFGGVDTLKSRFNDAGLKVFGSGWVMVTATPDGKLALETRPGCRSVHGELQRVCVAVGDIGTPRRDSLTPGAEVDRLDLAELHVDASLADAGAAHAGEVGLAADLQGEPAVE